MRLFFITGRGPLADRGIVALATMCLTVGCASTTGVDDAGLSGSYSLASINGAPVPGAVIFCCGSAVVVRGGLSLIQPDTVRITETDSAAGTPIATGTLATTVGKFLLHRTGTGFALEATATGTLGAVIDTLRVENGQLVTTHVPPAGSGGVTMVRVYQR